MVYDLMHVTIHKIILYFTTKSTSIDLCWGMNFDMVGQLIFNRRYFSTNATIEIKLSRQWNKFTVGYDLMHVTIHKIILCFTT